MELGQADCSPALAIETERKPRAIARRLNRNTRRYDSQSGSSLMAGNLMMSADWIDSFSVIF